jgi:hypothetical protein
MMDPKESTTPTDNQEEVVTPSTDPAGTDQQTPTDGKDNLDETSKSDTPTDG